MLIVNADDLGAAPATTDAILSCFDAGAISSASAMVWMADSERAARLARERGLPAGLHLNLTMPFDGPGVPPVPAARQARLVRRLGRVPALTRWMYRPLLRGPIAAEVSGQLRRFEELHGAPPTHLDGHNHAHLSPTVLRCGAIPPALPIRTNHDGSGRIVDGPRMLRRALISRRFVTADSFVSIRSVHPDLGGHGLGDVLALARERTVEIMVHPHWEDEYEVLMGAAWRDALDGVPLGSYAALSGGPAS